MEKRKTRKQTKTLEKEFKEVKEDIYYYQDYLCNPSNYKPEKIYKDEIPTKRDVLEMFHFYSDDLKEMEIPNLINQFNNGEISVIEFLDGMTWLREEYLSRYETTRYIVDL